MNMLFDALVAPLEMRRDAVLIRPDDSEVTGEQLFALSGQIANVLLDAGVEPGHRVAMQCEKSIEALALYLACLRVGSLFLPLNTAYMPAEMDYFVGDAEPTIVVSSIQAADQLAPICANHNATLFTLGENSDGTLMDAARVAGTDCLIAERGPDDLAVILYTSGTTGRSKGAMLSHKNLLSNAESLSEAWRFTSEDRLLHALPIFHAHGLFVAINVSLNVGASMIFLPKFDINVVMDKIGSATTMMGVPTFYTRMLADERCNSKNLSHMRLFVSGSAPLLAETHREFEAKTGQRILERYGMTETTMNSSNPYDGDRRAGTVGFPLPNIELRVVDPETGDELPKGDIGSLEVRGPNVFQGYWRMPEKTAEDFRDDGFFITGDIAKFDEDGYITIIGRSKDLVISGGYNVYPKEVETEIDDLDGVNESAVIGVPHPDFGEAVLAVVVPTSGVKLVADQITLPLQKRLAKFKCPKKVVFINALPRNTMGKVQKNELRKAYENTFQA
ncbi:MAG: malonyl-CoA synthase [Rhodobacteraceae bacterium]|jgi:malonyl-CoA/methylmalonyl-CoA synthetase|nr:malonyl-CoA synthase [Paracoccaceae bacterium]NCV67846.1 malonyl-CoA synthase [Paracoccaceae bacterium]NCW04164.1 malonyl-CoA synthase [Paracoccaceae bacterium]NCW66228.1 malonyl-CoA synthase [Paracoccaceae bacterium]NCX08140.1 malonyl-CoA synthase [Paracoccaceae bacterium]